MAIEYPNLPEVEVLLDGKPLPRELWERHAVYVSDLHDAMSGTRAVVYGCAGTVTIRRRNAGVLEPHPPSRKCGCAACLPSFSDDVAGVLCTDLPSDSVVLDFIAAVYIDLVAFEMPTGQGDADVGWKCLQHHMGESKPREVSVEYRDDPRAAIRNAMQALGYMPHGVPGRGEGKAE
jgi:hypothetical protein